MVRDKTGDFCMHDPCLNSPEDIFHRQPSLLQSIKSLNKILTSCARSVTAASLPQLACATAVFFFLWSLASTPPPQLAPPLSSTNRGTIHTLNQTFVVATTFWGRRLRRLRRLRRTHHHRYVRLFFSFSLSLISLSCLPAWPPSRPWRLRSWRTRRRQILWRHLRRE